MAKTVLVTGASGQLGTTLKALFGAQHQDFQLVYCRKRDLDITDPTQIEQWFSKNNFDYCINCAAYTHVEKAEDEPEAAKNVNTVAVGHLARACKTYGVILIHLSTDYVFDGTNEKPYRTSDTPNPLNVYGISKLMGEQVIRDILKPHYIIRVSWLYSKHYGNNFYRTIVHRALQGKEISVIDSQIGCPTDCTNLAKIIITEFLEKSPAFGIYHYCDGEPMNWYDFATKILKENALFDSTNLKRIKQADQKAKRPVYSVLFSDFETPKK